MTDTDTQTAKALELGDLLNSPYMDAFSGRFDSYSIKGESELIKSCKALILRLLGSKKLTADELNKLARRMAYVADNSFDLGKLVATEPELFEGMHTGGDVLPGSSSMPEFFGNGSDDAMDGYPEPDTEPDAQSIFRADFLSADPPPYGAPLFVAPDPLPD